MVKPEYIMIEIATKIAVYNKTWDVMRKATGWNGECETRAVGEDRTPPCTVRDPYGGQTVQIMLGHSCEMLYRPNKIYNQNSCLAVVYIESVTIKNLLSFEDAKFNFKKYNVIVGPNNAGKTNLVRILRAMVHSNLTNFEPIQEMKHAEGKKPQIQLAVEATNEETRLIMQALINKDIERETDLSSWKNFTIGLGWRLLSMKYSADPIIVYFQNHTIVSIDSGWHYVSYYDPSDIRDLEHRLDKLCSMDNAQIRRDVHVGSEVPMQEERVEKLITDGPLEFFSGNEHRVIKGAPIMLNTSGLEPHVTELVKYLDIQSSQHQFSLQQLISRIIRNNFLRSDEMHPTPLEITDHLYKLKNKNESAYRHLQTLFTEIFPNIDILVEQKDPDKDDTRTTFITEGNRKLDLANSASGYLGAIHILYTILNHTQRTIFLDEPEVHFHPAKIRQISRMLSKLTKERRNQITVITHSPKFLDRSLLDPDSQSMLTMVTKADDVSQVVSPKDLNVNLKPHMFEPDMFFSNAVFLVEGPRDEFVIKAIFDKFDEIFGAHEIAIVNCGGVDNIKQYIDFLDAYSIKYYGMADMQYGYNDTITVLAVDLEDELRKIKTVPFQVGTHQPKKRAVKDYYPYITELLETKEGFEELMQTKIWTSIKNVMDGFGVDVAVFKEKYKT